MSYLKTGKMVDLILQEYEKVSNSVTYNQFVKEFAEKNGLEIRGEYVNDAADDAWRTTGFKFNSSECELVFRLKYNYAGKGYVPSTDRKC